jgi:folate-binding Fe-S cluster repair protein YgfZ
MCRDGRGLDACIPCASKLEHGVVSRRTRNGRLRRRTYILKAEELVAAVAAQRASVEEQLLEGRDVGRVGVFSDGYATGRWAQRRL